MGVMDHFFSCSFSRTSGTPSSGDTTHQCQTLLRPSRPHLCPLGTRLINTAPSDTIREHFLHRLLQMPKLLLKISPSPIFSSLPNALPSIPPTPLPLPPLPPPQKPTNFHPKLSYLFGDFGKGIAHADILGTIDVNRGQGMLSVRRLLWLLHLPLSAVLGPPSGFGFFSDSARALVPAPLIHSSCAP